MAKPVRSILVLALTFAMLVVPASTAASQCPTCLLSGVFDIADVDEDKTILAGWASHSDARRCMEKDACPNLGGVLYADVDISEEMERYTDHAYFRVTNGIVSETTMWVVCSYDEGGELLDCFRDYDPNFGFRADLSGDAHELRLMPVQSAPNEYHVHVFAE